MNFLRVLAILLLAGAVSGQPPIVGPPLASIPQSIKVLPPKRHGNPPKASTVQMTSARTSLLVVIHPPVTNYLTIQFIAVPLDTNKVIWVQSTSQLNNPLLPFTNVVGFIRNTAVIEETFGCTAAGRSFRLSWQP